MNLLKMAGAAISDPNIYLIMADFLTDHPSTNPEKEYYIKRLRNPSGMFLHTLVDIVAKFGEKHERSQVRKMVKFALKNSGIGKNRIKRKNLHLVVTSGGFSINKKLKQNLAEV